MEPADWQRVKALFEAVVDRHPDRRTADLAEACHDRPDIRQAVESLLANDAAAKSFMESPAAARAGLRSRPSGAPDDLTRVAGVGEIGVALAPRVQSLELPTLLRKRLRSLTVIELLAFGFFYAGRFFRSITFTPLFIWGLMIPGSAFIAFMTGMAAFLWRRRLFSLRQLRIVEGMVFGAIALFYLNETYIAVFVEPGWFSSYAQRHPMEMSILARQSAIIWLVHIIAYGTFIPNTGRRCAVVTSLMAASALATVAVAGRLHHVDSRALSLYIGEMVMWMSVAVAMAVYGSQKITALREEALAARKLGQYQLKRRLGEGGMGEVYLAEHVLLRRPCAVKIIRPEQAGDARTLQRFLREVQATATLTHPNTIQVFDYGQAADGTMFYAMEYLTGLNLEELVGRQGPFSAARTIFVLRQLCGALGEAHAIGLIHRDIKPSNVILGSRGGRHDVAKLLDFGLVRMQSRDARDTRLTQAGLIFGTPAYMSPEQAAGHANVDRRSDIYSLGALACFLLTGAPAFVRPTMAQTLAAHIDDPVTPLRTRVPSIPEDLDAVVLRCLRKRADERFADMAELECALAACRAADEWTQADAASWTTASDGLTDQMPANRPIQRG
jgi:tRNA A-37 threonylcarbamoyl transferase component Bud32